MSGVQMAVLLDLNSGTGVPERVDPLKLESERIGGAYLGLASTGLPRTK